MSKRALRFIEIEQEMPGKRDAVQRTRDFDEIYSEYAEAKAVEQASRCSQCGVPFCQIHCPLSNNIPDWLLMTAEGRLEEAYEMVEDGQIGEEDFRDFVFTHPARLHAGMNPGFFKGTVVEGAVERLLAESAD